MSTRTSPNRQPAGTPTGGQFAAGSTGEPSGVALSVHPYDPVANPGADYEAELDGELESLSQYVRAERTVEAAEQVIAKIEAMPGLLLAVEQRRTEAATMFSGDEAQAAQARRRLVRGDHDG